MNIKLKALLFSSYVSVAMVAFAVPARAAAAHECVAAKPTAASYTWDFKGEANTIFQAVQADAEQAVNHADMLQSFAQDPGFSWQTHQNELLALKAEINDIGDKLCRLETIRRAVTPWQQAEIDRIATAARLMADNTQDAIRFGNDHQADFWLPAYQKYTNNLYDQARSLANSVGNAVAYARVSRESRDLERKLGMRKSS